MPRKARLDAPGTLHHVMIRGIEKRLIVQSDKDRQDFVDRMGNLTVKTGTVIYAWALLPNHAHILLRSGPSGLPTYMRRLLTGYAVAYNLRHKRHGHLFQNRYKSIVCDEDEYFKELVRYIHLNPLRAKLVTEILELDKFPWSGHSVIMGNCSNDWQDRDYVLSWFGSKERVAMSQYNRFVSAGVKEGRRPELVGGGLVRSQGGWAEVKSLRKLGIQSESDDRILGNSDFVGKILEEADSIRRKQFEMSRSKESLDNLIDRNCKKAGISVNELKNGGRRKAVSQVRGILSSRLVEEYGLSFADTARLLGVSTSAVSKILGKREE